MSELLPDQSVSIDVREMLARALYDAYIWDLDEVYGAPVGWEHTDPGIQGRFRDDAGNVLALLGFEQ